jgi:hypothetical protein
MSTLIPEVVNTKQIKTAEFVEWTKYTYDTGLGAYRSEVFYFSSGYKNETFQVDGVTRTFENLGGLLSVGAQQRDISATRFDTSIVLMGLDPDEIYRVVDRNTKGSQIKIWRGFYDDKYILGNVYLRFTGVVTSYSTSEQYSGIENTIALSLNCSSSKWVLETLISGRKTNSDSWKLLNPADKSMDNITSLSGTTFNFGKEVK